MKTYPESDAEALVAQRLDGLCSIRELLRVELHVAVRGRPVVVDLQLTCAETVLCDFIRELRKKEDFVS